MANHGWIGVDLDGTLAHYDKWKGIEHIGEPVDRIVRLVNRLIADGREVRIFTARVSRNREEANEARRHIDAWCMRVFGLTFQVTCVKDMGMVLLIDDRAIGCEKNTGKLFVDLEAMLS